MKNKSKIDVLSMIGAAVISLVTLALIIYVILDFSITVLILSLVFLAILGIYTIPVYLNTKYELMDNEIFITTGFFHKKISYENIRAAKESRCPISSWALSLDRICIKYNKFDEIYISPINKKEFLQELQQRIVKNKEA